jgi:hypothetical protein
MAVFGNRPLSAGEIIRMKYAANLLEICKEAEDCESIFNFASENPDAADAYQIAKKAFEELRS